jgi:transcriptional regulator with XRE-family HTH domain
MKKNDLAIRLKELRTLRGMSQEYLAEEARVSLRTIQRIENEESVPTGETVNRISAALGFDLNEFIGSKSREEKSDLKATTIYLKKQLSKTSIKSEIKTFENFIRILNILKEKEMTSEQMEGIKSYINYLELEKIPSFSNEMYSQKLRKLKKYLKTKLRFVPNWYYTNIGLSFTIPFVIAFIANNAFGIELILFALTIFTACVLMDFRIKSQGRSLRF